MFRNRIFCYVALAGLAGCSDSIPAPTATPAQVEEPASPAGIRLSGILELNRDAQSGYALRMGSYVFRLVASTGVIDDTMLGLQVVAVGRFVSADVFSVSLLEVKDDARQQ